MSAESDTAFGVGLSGSLGWLVGGSLGGAVGAAAFGLLMVVVDPEIVETAIPAIYGLDMTGIVGWGIHIVHGLVLGVVFGALVTRDFVLGILSADVETDALSMTGAVLRIVGAGFVFGLTIWAILPVLVAPVWASAIGGTAGDFPAAAIESLLGHLLFGTVLGIVFAATVDLRDLSSDRWLAE